VNDSVALVVPNVAEFNLRHPALRLDPGTERGFAGRAALLIDQSVFWTGGDRVLLLPEGYDRLWLDDVHEVQDEKPPPIVSPRRRSSFLARDLLADPEALARLRGLLADREVRLVSWGATPELYTLVDVLRGYGLTVVPDGTPQESYWASLYLDAKLSCLDLARDIPEIRTPAGITTTSWEELRGATEHLADRHGRVIVRSPYGASGSGAVVVRAGSLGTAALWSAVQTDPQLRVFPLTVQQYVEHAPGVGCPAIDVRIDDDGVSETVLSCMTVDGHRFRSVNVGAGALSAAESARTVRAGHRIGAAAWELGFRGWFCVDFVAGADGRLYVTEFNARRSGAMPAIGLLREWNAHERMTMHIHDTVALPGSGRASYRDTVRPAFQRLWRAGHRALPLNVRGVAGRPPTLGLLTAGNSAEEATGLAQRLIDDIAAARIE
jgi:hypothetical protein